MIFILITLCCLLILSRCTVLAQSPFEYWTDIAVSGTGGFLYGLCWTGGEVGIFTSTTYGDTWLQPLEVFLTGYYPNQQTYQWTVGAINSNSAAYQILAVFNSQVFFSTSSGHYWSVIQPSQVSTGSVSVYAIVLPYNNDSFPATYELLPTEDLNVTRRLSLASKHKL